MSDEIREQLSALMDGELPRDQVRFLLRRIDGNPQVMHTWARYQLAGNVLGRRAPVLPLRDDFAEALMQRLDTGSTSIGMRVLRWAGGGAIAAAVAVFALVSTRQAVGPEAAAALASAPGAAVVDVPVARKGMPSLPPQPMFDFAQPASYDKDNGVITLPSYRREQQPVTLGPYVLLTAPSTQTTADASPQR